MNPWHTIPVVREEDGFTVSESRAILAYLADRQGEQGKIENPSDARGRAMVNMMLHFDISTFYRAMLDAVVRKKTLPKMSLPPQKNSFRAPSCSARRAASPRTSSPPCARPSSGWRTRCRPASAASAAPAAWA